MIGTKLYKGQFTNEEYANEAIWANNNNAYISDEGEYYETKEIVMPAPTEEEQRQRRSEAYQQEVDPITAHIQRLRDEEQTEEVIAEIQALIVERDEKVESIRQRYPYPVGSTEE